jgi:hypothetical protein
MCEMHLRTLDFRTVLKDRLMSPDQSYSQVGREPPYRSSYVVDYEAQTGLSLLGVPQQSIWSGASCVWTMPLTPHQWLCLGPSPVVTGTRPPRGLYSRHTEYHCIDDPPDMGLYIQHGNIRFYHTICKCINNIRDVIG